jgi:hypothetical protein
MLITGTAPYQPFTHRENLIIFLAARLAKVDLKTNML